MKTFFQLATFRLRTLRLHQALRILLLCKYGTITNTQIRVLTLNK